MRKYCHAPIPAPRPDPARRHCWNARIPAPKSRPDADARKCSGGGSPSPPPRLLGCTGGSPAAGRNSPTRRRTRRRAATPSPGVCRSGRASRRSGSGNPRSPPRSRWRPRNSPVRGGSPRVVRPAVRGWCTRWHRAPPPMALVFSAAGSGSRQRWRRRRARTYKPARPL